MTKLKGRDVSLSMEIDGQGRETIAYAKDCTLNVQCDVQEFTSALSGRGKRFKPGRYGWNVNVGTLIADSEQPLMLLELLLNGGQLTLTMDVQLVKGGAIHTLVGNAIVRTWDFGAPLKGLATFSASFVGDGELTPVQKRNPVPAPRT